MAAVLQLLSLVLSAYLVVLMGRVVFDLIMAFSRGWRPQGFLLVLANVVYTLTDPPLRWLRRFIPPLRLGAVSLDLGFLVLFLVVSFSRSLLATLAAQM